MFLDRDGVIVRDVSWLRDIRQLRLLPGAAAAIGRLNQARIPVVVATNQSALARQWLTPEALAEIHAELRRRLGKAGAHLDGIYVCPHHPTAGRGALRVQCGCRKPEPGLLLQAAEELGLALSESVVIGDKISDLRAGRKVGCATVLVLTGQGRQQYRQMKCLGEQALADHVSANLSQAVAWLLGPG